MSIIGFRVQGSDHLRHGHSHLGPLAPKGEPIQGSAFRSWDECLRFHIAGFQGSGPLETELNLGELVTCARFEVRVLTFKITATG